MVLQMFVLVISHDAASGLPRRHDVRWLVSKDFLSFPQQPKSAAPPDTLPVPPLPLLPLRCSL